jgi:putative NADH-flavin reductase
MMDTILVIGANGGIGRQVVEQALDAGYKVKALVRDPAKIGMEHVNLSIIKGDVLKPESYSHSLQGVSAVISALGARGTGPTTLYSSGNEMLLKQMERAGVSRMYCISASGLDVNPSHPFLVRWLTKHVLQRILSNMYADQRVMESLVRASPLDWTIVRPPRLTDKPVTGRYRTTIDQMLIKPYSIARADVAHFMLHSLSDERTFRHLVEVAY